MGSDREVEDVNEEFKLDATGYNRIAYCSKCNVSDFYKYPATEDSRCCGDKLKPKNKKCKETNE